MPSRFGRMVDGLRLGDRIRVEGPAGNFTLSDALATTPLLFIAGGTGIAPLRSMIRDLVDARHAAPLALVYSARTPSEFAYLQELRALADDGRLTLTTVTGTGLSFAGEPQSSRQARVARVTTAIGGTGGRSHCRRRSRAASSSRANP